MPAQGRRTPQSQRLSEGADRGLVMVRRRTCAWTPASMPATTMERAASVRKSQTLGGEAASPVLCARTGP